MGQTSSKADGLKASLAKMWRITGGIVLFNIIRSVTRAFKDLIGTVLSFEEAMYNVNSVAQVDAKALQALTDQVVDLALDPRIKDGPTKLAEGLYTIVSSGYKAKDALVILEQAALASTAGMTTTAVAADVLVSTLGAYNLGVDSAKKVTDQLFQIVNISKYTFEDLSSSLDSVTPSAAALGIGIEEIGAAMAVFAKHGVDAQTATVQMNGILTALLKPTDAMKTALGELGYASGQAMLDNLGFVETMKQLALYVGEDSSKAAALFGDVRALRGEMNLTNDGGVLLTEMLVQMGYAEEGLGATTKALNEQMKSNSFQIAVFRKNLQILAVLGFGMIAPYLNKALTTVNTFVSGTIKAFRQFRKNGLGIFDSLRFAVSKVLTAMFGTKIGDQAAVLMVKFEDLFGQIKNFVETVGPVVLKFFGFFLKHLDDFVPAILGAVIGVKLLTTALKVQAVVVKLLAIQFTPLLIAFIVIAALAALLFVAWTKNWFGIRDKTKIAIKAIWGFIGPFVGKFMAATETLRYGFKRLIEGWKEGGLVGMLKELFGAGGNAILTGLGRIIAIIPRMIGKFFRSIHTGFAPLDNIFRVLGNIWTDFGLLIQNIMAGKWGKAFEYARRLFKDFMDYTIMIPKLLLGIFQAIPWSTIGHGLYDGIVIAVKFLVDTGVPWMYTESLKLIDSMYKAFTEFWDSDIAPFIGQIGALIVGILALAIPIVKQAGNDIIGGMWDGISFAIDWGFDWFRKLPDWIKGVFSGAKDWLFWVGHEIMNGLWSGMVDVVNWMRQNFAALFTWMPDIVKDKLGINSPSKVFAEIGMGIPEGMALGISQGMRHIESAMGSMNVSVNPGRSRRGVDTGSLAHLGARAASSQSRAGHNVTFQEGSIVVHSNDGEKVAGDILRALDRKLAGAH